VYRMLGERIAQGSALDTLQCRQALQKAASAARGALPPLLPLQLPGEVTITQPCYLEASAATNGPEGRASLICKLVAFLSGVSKAVEATVAVGRPYSSNSIITTQYFLLICTCVSWN
jgi:hypothetical protein